MQEFYFKSSKKFSSFLNYNFIVWMYVVLPILVNTAKNIAEEKDSGIKVFLFIFF